MAKASAQAGLRELVATLCLVFAAVIVQVTEATYGECNTTCNQYVLDRICIEDDVTEDAWVPNATSAKIGVMRDFSGTNAADFASMCALKNVREEGVLDGIDVDLRWLDTNSDMLGGMRAGLCMRKSGMDAAVGPFSSDPAEGAALIGNIYDINTVATTATSPDLSDTSSYSYFSRVIGSDSNQGSMLATLAAQYGWTEIAVLYIATDTYFEGVANAFTDKCIELGISIDTYTLASTDYSESKLEENLQKIRESEVRVVMASMTPMHDTLTIANETGMLDEGWAWLTTESAISILWSNGWNLPDSDLENMDVLLDGVIGLVPQVNTSSQAYNDWYDCIVDHMNETNSSSMFYGLGDAARAATYTSTELASMTEEEIYNGTLTAMATMWYAFYYDAMQITLRAFASLDASDRSDTEKLRAAIRNTTYDGATGSIVLDSDGERTSMAYSIGNIFGKEYHVIGEVTKVDDSIEITFTQDAHFPGNTTDVPVGYEMDCDLEDDYNQTVSECHGSSRTVTYIQSTNKSKLYCPDVTPFDVSCDHALYTDASMPLDMIGYGLVFLTLVLFLWVWNHRLIKLSQREFLIVMLLGACVALTGPLLSFGQLNFYKCATLPIFTSLGYVLLFGPLFVKSWRVGVLVRNTKLRHMKVPSYQLYARLFVMLAITSILLGLMFYLDPPHVESTTEPITYDGEIHVVPFQTCTVDGNLMSSMLIFALALFTAYGCYVSYQIRNVSEDLSEARWIFLSIYNGALLSAIMLAIVLGLDLTFMQIHLFATLGILIVSVFTVALIMVPKFINIFKDQPLSEPGLGTSSAAFSYRPGTVDVSYLVGPDVTRYGRSNTHTGSKDSKHRVEESETEV